MDKKDYKAIGKRIRYLRIEKKLTQEKIAEKADISVNYVSQIENGEAKFSLGVMIGLINALDSSADYILSDVINTGADGSIGFKSYSKLTDTHVEFIDKFIELTGQYHMVK